MGQESMGQIPRDGPWVSRTWGACQASESTAELLGSVWLCLFGKILGQGGCNSLRTYFVYTFKRLCIFKVGVKGERRK